MGIVGKIFSSCRTWSKVMMSEVKQWPTLITAGYGQHRSRWINYHNLRPYVTLGIPGLSECDNKQLLDKVELLS